MGFVALYSSRGAEEGFCLLCARERGKGILKIVSIIVDCSLYHAHHCPLCSDPLHRRAFIIYKPT